ncbi:hypothetical protein ACOQFV_26550 [Nocardiopsis changdeensis]|uniref:XRE family transcriptional regulator n=1 Tax=Nocardiopsis changdeensis TaxID=2831969 RepID=A0ABX8BEY6_9ACTN|nr:MULTISPECIES: hypothetical protein [Nocardiopsis]QUX20592.1 hypothetical protein KGD84_18985 [Nocardiopsis changdeensis]QYX36523.1 hypothetical protein K1J57_28440 [Nocardiopsis sp. MT53]
MTRTCEAMNKAALVASDTGQPDLAEALCWQQYDVFASAGPLTAKTALLALQPLVNLGRLAIRTGHPTAAHTVFESLLTATTPGQPAQVQGRTCPVADLVTSPSERTELRRFLWAVMLADGTRALCVADRWQDAVEHLHRYNGIGTRLLDGRQVAVLAALHRQDPDAARILLEGTVCNEPWEQAVAACLTAASARVAGHDPADAVTAMARHLIELPPTPGGAVFAARAGVLACELAPGHRALVSHVIDTVMGSNDANAATAVLGSPVVGEELSLRQRQTLRERVRQAELVRADQPASLTEELTVICDQAATHLVCRLKHAYPHLTP